MESWQKDFLQTMGMVTGEVEQFFYDLTEVVDGIAAEIDQVMADATEPILELYLGLETVVGEAAQPIVQTVQPILEEHAACVGCRHYYGQVDGGNLLICAMHPYGCNSDRCPDWQSAWDQS